MDFTPQTIDIQMHEIEPYDGDSVKRSKDNYDYE